MAESIISSFSNAVGEFTAKGNATPIVSNVLRCLKSHLHYSYAAIFQKNPKNEMIEITQQVGIFKTVVKDFKRNIGKNVIGKIFLTDRMIIINRDKPEEGHEELILDKPFETAIFTRISIGAHPMGFLGVYFDEKKEIDDESKDMLNLSAEICAAAIEREEMINLIKELKRYDPETGLYCLQYFNHKLSEEFAKSMRYKHPFTLIILDVDNFKHIINTFGYSAAQEVLRELSEELKFCIRGIDIPGAFGRDEFIVGMPSTPPEKAEIVIKRYLERVKKAKFSKHRISTSFSAGMTGTQPDDTVESLIWRAQLALYEARKQGTGILKRV
ncbi:MAG: GGDEF domain-containing protein [Candidatus Riflebacteria bacterium]|nr:GGDEF domain-containing protein [Candidatus Riflebacteria bacterium]